MGDLVRTCCVCNAIEKGGRVVPRGAPGNVGNEHYPNSTSTYLSRGCMLGEYGEELTNKTLEGVNILDRCPTLDEFLLEM